MTGRPLVRLHGYSADAAAFTAWQAALVGAGWSPAQLLPISYETRANEVSIRDLAEAFDALLDAHPVLADGEPFDVLLHSTGMLVLRAWLAHPAPSRAHQRRARLRSVIALAPATFGSPLAHKGRSFVGALLRGRKAPGPDFLEAGDQVLDALELGSRFTWELAHADLFGAASSFGAPGGSRGAPSLFVFCGTRTPRGMAALAHTPGTDGVVRWAGCALTSRKLQLDLTPDCREPSRLTVCPWTHADAPMIPVEGVDHAGILAAPPARLVAMVVEALRVRSRAAYRAWQDEALAWSAAARSALPAWQQFVVRAVDERGDSIHDWNLQFALADGTRLTPFTQEVHVYREDPSLRTFHVRLDRLPDALHDDPAQALEAQLVASTGSHRVHYRGYVESPSLAPRAVMPQGTSAPSLEAAGRTGLWSGAIRLPATDPTSGVRLFHPHTTTFLEIRLDREPRIGPDAVARWG